jgi:hypothetical protein
MKSGMSFNNSSISFWSIIQRLRQPWLGCARHRGPKVEILGSSNQVCSLNLALMSMINRLQDLLAIDIQGFGISVFQKGKLGID